MKARYLHSEIDTLERIQIIRELRLGEYDVLVGVNLLREARPAGGLARRDPRRGQEGSSAGGPPHSDDRPGGAPHQRRVLVRRQADRGDQDALGETDHRRAVSSRTEEHNITPLDHEGRLGHRRVSLLRVADCAVATPSSSKVEGMSREDLEKLVVRSRKITSPRRARFSTRRSWRESRISRD